MGAVRRADARFLTLAALVCLALCVRCGFLSQARISEAYIEEFAPDDAAECLVTWPIHAIALPITAMLDQGIHTFEAIPPAGRDAGDFFLMEFSQNNVMLARTVAVPKLLATPAIFIGSYLVRWFVPIGPDDRPFGEPEESEVPEPEEPEGRKEPETIEEPQD
jgi:hypothetical protein